MKINEKSYVNPFFIGIVSAESRTEHTKLISMRCFKQRNCNYKGGMLEHNFCLEMSVAGCQGVKRQSV